MESKLQWSIFVCFIFFYLNSPTTFYISLQSQTYDSELCETKLSMWLQSLRIPTKVRIGRFKVLMTHQVSVFCFFQLGFHSKILSAKNAIESHFRKIELPLYGLYGSRLSARKHNKPIRQKQLWDTHTKSVPCQTASFLCRLKTLFKHII